MNKKFLLDEGWKFRINEKKSIPEKPFLKKIKATEWLDAKVPGTVLTDLLRLNLIPDPFYSDNELKLQWIGETDWRYTTIFNSPKDFDKDKSVYLVFEGIDTAAAVILNGKELGTVNNMFLKYEYEVSSLLKKKRNKLELVFTSPINYAKELESRYGSLSAALNSERVFTRKAQYSFGWDWGPKFAVMGLWRPVYLIQRENTSLENFTFSTLFIENRKAKIEIKVNTNQTLNPSQRIKIELKKDTQTFEFEMSGDNTKSFKNQFEIR